MFHDHLNYKMPLYIFYIWILIWINFGRRNLPGSIILMAIASFSTFIQTSNFQFLSSFLIFYLFYTFNSFNLLFYLTFCSEWRHNSPTPVQFLYNYRYKFYVCIILSCLDKCNFCKTYKSLSFTAQIRGNFFEF